MVPIRSSEILGVFALAGYIQYFTHFNLLSSSVGAYIYGLRLAGCWVNVSEQLPMLGVAVHGVLGCLFL